MTEIKKLSSVLDQDIKLRDFLQLMLILGAMLLSYGHLNSRVSENAKAVVVEENRREQQIEYLRLSIEKDITHINSELTSISADMRSISKDITQIKETLAKIK